MLEKEIDSSDFKEVYEELNKIKYFDRKRDPFLLYLQNKRKDKNKFNDIVLLEDKNNRIKQKHYKDLQDSLFPTTDSIQIFKREEIEKTSYESLLFYWCILTNRLEMAKVFWKYGKVLVHFLKFILKVKNLYQYIRWMTMNYLYSICFKLLFFKPVPNCQCFCRMQNIEIFWK